MSEDILPSSDKLIRPVSVTPSGAGSEQPDSVILVSYPKIVFLYPTVLTSLFCSIFMWVMGDLPVANTSAKSKAAEVSRAAIFIQSPEESVSDNAQGEQPPTESTAAAPATTEPTPPATAIPAEIEGPTYHYICGRLFLTVFAVNFVIIAFEFPRTTSLTWFFAIVALVIAIMFLLSGYPHLAPKVIHALLGIKPAANAAFYMIYTLIMLILYGWVMISRRFDYWEVKGNELLHHHGILSNLERFSAPNLRIDKEINDLFEYFLLRSGRLIIHPSNERRAVVLDNILRINDKEDRITRMLGALQVRVRPESDT